MASRDDIRDHVDDTVHGAADAAAVAIDDLAGQQRTLLCLEVEILEEIFVDALDLARPGFIIRIGFALMQEDTGNHSVLLGLPGEIDHIVVRIASVDLHDVLQPVRTGLAVFLSPVLHECIYLAACHGNVDDTHSVSLREVLKQGTAEIVGRGKTGVLAAERRDGRIPVALRTVHAGEIHRGHHQVIGADALTVLVLDAGVALHVGLADADEDVEILVYGATGCTGNRQRHKDH